MRYFVYLILVLFAGLLGPTVRAAVLPDLPKEGYDRGNAGDAFVSEFVLTGRDVVQKLDLLFQDNKAVVDTAALHAAIDTTEVVSEEHVYLNGFERDAVNFYPQQRRISVNRTRWRDLRRATETKDRLRLVLHEYLWISGVDDTNFQHSEHLIEMLNVENYSPNIWWNPVNPVNYVVATLSFSPPGCAFQPAKFDPKSSDETVVLETTGECKDAYRKLQIAKTAGVTPPSSNVHGLFHKFEMTVFDSQQQVKGEMSFEPEWGVCLIPGKDGCQSSGKMEIGGVEIVFWFLKD